MARIRLQNINKQFGEHKALIDFNLDVADGEFFVLLGPTGAGKTTTLRLISGLDKPTTGDIFINDSVRISGSRLVATPERSSSRRSRNVTSPSQVRRRRRSAGNS